MGKHKLLLIFIFGGLIWSGLNSQSHPNLILTERGISEIKDHLGQLPFLDNSLEEAIREVDADISNGIQVPIPKDMAGGYTHERHKKNYLILQKAGVLYQITDQEKYAIHVRDVLMEYAKIFPTLPLHPTNRSYAPGKIFWQCLNDANWMVYMSQAYDCVYNFLTPGERDYLEKDLFRPFADHISIDSPQFFNRVHNHSTWGNAAVGMMGLVMNDEVLINRGLYGLDTDDININQKDDDGGLIKLPGQATAGFFANLDYPFSPDGYYTEGPYYQRYAMYPFLLFAQSLENYMRELKIFEYGDSVLSKAVYAILNLTDANGEFFPFNDAQKGMSYLSRELVSSIDIIYHFCGNDPQLLSIAKKQGKVLLDDTGLSVALGLKNEQEQPFVKGSIELRDGRNGEEGGVGIIRSGNGNDEMCLVMKYTGHGLSHGHYDKLSYMLLDDGEEVIRDYGMARFVNIDQKFGGAYLPENTTWAKQTIAHNTVIVNRTSHFDGDYNTSSLFHSDRYIFSVKEKEIQIVSAKETNAYPGVILHRTMALITDPEFEKPLVLDIFRVDSDNENQYDLPFYFNGQVISMNFDFSNRNHLSPMGAAAGYQHLWLEGTGNPVSNSKLSWLSNSRFYTLTTLTSDGDSLLFGRIGANDPEFNLRRDPLFIVRKSGVIEIAFVSIIETHGHYDPVSEIAENASGTIENLEVLLNSDAYTCIVFSNKNGSEWMLLLSNLDADESMKHNVKINGEKYRWTGPFTFNKR